MPAAAMSTFTPVEAATTAMETAAAATAAVTATTTAVLGECWIWR